MTSIFKINFSTSVDSLAKLPMLRMINETNNMKPNFAKIARELDVDWRTVKRHYMEGAPSKNRRRKSNVDDLKPLIQKLLLDDSTPQKFYYKSVLWRYLCDNYGLTIKESTFRQYILKHKEFQNYFDKHKGPKKKAATVHFETAPGEQAQLDWKENISFLDANNQMLTVNVLSLTFSYSRRKAFWVTADRSRETLLHALTNLFEKVGGVPKTVLTDNMKTIVDVPQRRGAATQFNPEILEFARTFGFEIKACRPRTPQTKGKVETGMKFLDEIHAYQGQLDFDGLCKQVQVIEDRINMNICQSTGCSPLQLWEKEKESLSPLPRTSLRNSFKILQSSVKASNTNMISYNGCTYSVPAGYALKRLNLTVEKGILYLYDNTELIAQHRISNKKKNYIAEHYLSQLQAVQPHLTEEESILQAKSNLERIDELYGTAYRLQQAKRKSAIHETETDAPASRRKHRDC